MHINAIICNVSNNRHFTVCSNPTSPCRQISLLGCLMQLQATIVAIGNCNSFWYCFIVDKIRGFLAFRIDKK